MPFLSEEILVYCVDRAKRSCAEVVVPRSSSGLEPLCACWRTDAVEAVRKAFEDGVRKVTEAMKRVSMEVVGEEDWARFDKSGRLFWNMNTPAEYEEARRILEEERR
jgi:molybdopterin-guanine dinucleotide biosynthesis protein A